MAGEYIKAFLVGGALCTAAQLLIDFTKMTPARILVLYVTSGVALTALGLYSPLVKFAGAGALVPITGFANAVVSPAIDNRSEGWILGVGAKLFSIAGPVIVYGTAASVVYGILYWVYQVIVK